MHPKLDDVNEDPMISISTISASLSTDDTVTHRKRYFQPRICCVLPVNTVSLIGVALSAIFTLSFYIYSLIRTIQNDEVIYKTRVIGLLSATACIILLFSILFTWGLYSKKSKFMLPFIALTIFIVFALSAICIFFIVTAAGDSKNNNSSETIAEMVVFRIILIFIACVLSFFVFVYMKSYLYVRRVQHS